MAAEFKHVDDQTALGQLDELGDEVRQCIGAGARPREQLDALRDVLARSHGFAGDREQYDDPRNSMLDVVLERRAGLPILLSAVYVEVARRAGIDLEGVGLPGHFVVGHFGTVPALLLDPFDGGAEPDLPGELSPSPWGVHDTVLRMLNNLLGSYRRRNDLGRAIRAAEMRLVLAGGHEVADLERELRALRARLN
jgi:hypothetical protein